jgi:hypothetical protein
MRKLIISTSLFLISIAGFAAVHYRNTTPLKPDSVEPTASADHWHIKGALSEACTCKVPCTCNFGEGPSPHSYCYVVYAYEIREGHFNGIKLDGLRFGATDAANGKALYLDARASDGQRSALEALARKVMKVSGEHAGRDKLLGIKSVQIKQEYDDRHDLLDLGGAGASRLTTSWVKTKRSRWSS